jgi:hypothetical protein
MNIAKKPGVFPGLVQCFTDAIFNAKAAEGISCFYELDDADRKWMKNLDTEESRIQNAFNDPAIDGAKLALIDLRRGNIRVEAACRKFGDRDLARYATSMMGGFSQEYGLVSEENIAFFENHGMEALSRVTRLAMALK